MEYTDTKTSKRYIKKPKTLMCLGCFNIFNTVVDLEDEDDYYIKNNNICTCNFNRFATIDTDISTAISIFNKKGYSTLYCCSGHYNKKYDDNGYIYFVQKVILDYIHLLPDTWYLDIAELKYYDRIVIRSTYINKDNYHEAMMDILSFAQLLPKNQGGFIIYDIHGF